MEYVSYKRAFERGLLLFQLQVIAMESLESEEISKFVREAFIKAMGDNKKLKFINRCHNETKRIIEPIVRTKDKLSGHKFILIMHSLVEQIIESGYDLPQFVVDTFEPFLEIEAEAPLPTEEWLALKSSAEKSARKIYDKLISEGYYKV